MQRDDTRDKEGAVWAADLLSYWEWDYLLRDIDFLIVGSGLVGLSSAIEILESTPSAKVLILDKKTLPVGASTRNAGFACFGSVSEIMSDIETYGEDAAAELIALRYQGLQKLRDRVPDQRMRYKQEPGIEVFEGEDGHRYVDHISDINRVAHDAIGIRGCFSSGHGRFGIEIQNPHEGSLYPQLMIAALEIRARALGVRFMQGVELFEIDYSSRVLQTSHGVIEYKKLIICTNGFSQSFLSDVDVQPARNQVIISAPMPGFSLPGCYHMNEGYVYFREVDSRLLIGGARHLDMDGEHTSDLGTTDVILSYLTSLAKERIVGDADFRVEMTWSGILGVGSHKTPLVKWVDDHVLLAIRMGGMGVAIGSAIGAKVAQMVSDIGGNSHDY